MIVYGDPEFEVSLGRATELIEARAARTSAMSIHDWRALLIQAGQLEQGVADHAPCLDTERRQVEAMTDLAARAFCFTYLVPRSRKGFDGASCHDALQQIRRIASLMHASSARLHIKVPEGFAFYALFPEQYCEAALAWSRVHPSTKSACVIGVRSIGTSLSAVVARTLEWAGRKVVRFTVRPYGPPFHRQVLLAQEPPTDVEHVLVVDEGPGLSGSSMASVASALFERGYRPGRISFFPGHRGAPGPAADERIRAIWQSIAYHVASQSEVCWNGESLPQLLLEKSQNLFPENNTFSIENISGGAWRGFSFKNETDWPAVAPCFERMKFLVRTASGEAVLWKFCGLAFGDASGCDNTQVAHRETHRRAESGAVSSPLGESMGFLASRWQQGRCLTPVDAQRDLVLCQIARVLGTTAKNYRTCEEAQASLERLKELLYSNIAEGIDSRLALSICDCAKFVSPRVENPRAGDGRMAPYEWRETALGEIVKTNSVPHDCDHTWIGPQSVYWDIAGCVIEWNLDPARRRKLLALLRQQVPSLVAEDLNFYCSAYTAFRMGVCQLAAATAAPSENNRLLKAAKHYFRQLLQFTERFLRCHSKEDSPSFV